MVSNGNLGKGYVIWPSISGVSCYGCCWFGVTLEHMWSIPCSLSHHTRVTSVPALSAARADQVQLGLCSGRKLRNTVTTVTWLLIRHWFSWWQESFSTSHQSAKDSIPLDWDPQRARIMRLVEGFLICQALLFVAVQASETKADSLCEFANSETPF